MPTPYGSRGGMAFSAAELVVLRRSLAHALHSGTDRALTPGEVKDCLRLAQALDDAVREAERLRAFLLDDLRRYREALPGSLGGYLEMLQDALAAGYQPVPDDLAALRALRGNRVAAALLQRCQVLAEKAVRAKLGAALTPAPRLRLLALPGGGERSQPDPKPRPDPAPAEPKAPRPDRPIPTPGEVFPPRRKPAPPAEGRAAG
ncbi:hypothetical protein [Streptomyces sp. NPDC093225]|uniref:hypothetical protein n=1 Tax=Streptomyces sp. NPDC093225 TaxID=3366034 RepID=UPI003829390F